MKVHLSLAFISILSFSTPILSSDILSKNALDIVDNQENASKVTFRYGYETLDVHVSPEDTVADVKQRVREELNIPESKVVYFGSTALLTGNFYENFHEEIQSNSSLFISHLDRTTQWEETIDTHYSKGLMDYPFIQSDNFVALFLEKYQELENMFSDTGMKVYYAKERGEIQDANVDAIDRLMGIFVACRNSMFYVMRALVETYENKYYTTGTGEHLETIPTLGMLDSLNRCSADNLTLPTREDLNQHEQEIINDYIAISDIANENLDFILRSLGF